MKPVLKALVVASTLALAAGAAEARDLRLAPGAPPVHPAYAMYKTMMVNLPKETNGAYTGTIIGPEVVNIVQVKQALQSSLAEVGNLLPLFVPADLPSTALAGDLALQATNPHAMAAAMTEYVVTCKDCQREFKKFGAVYTGSGSSDIYVILSTKPARSLKELKGLRLRSGGAPYARWAEAAGAAPTQVPVSDQFEAVSQGVLDGSMGSIQDLLSYRLIDVVKYVIDLPLGTYHTTANFAVATAAWKEMSPEQRAGFVRAANLANVAFTQDWGYDRSGAARKAAREAGIEFIKPSQDMLDQIEKFRANDIKAAAKLSKDQLGLDDGAEKIERFQALVKKWTGIVKELNGDPAAIAQRIQKEVWDKVDYSTYGL
ncbi:MAG: TRAP transporter substrate-binding protein DctP [Xanthobacteraceae bacterium]